MFEQKLDSTRTCLDSAYQGALNDKCEVATTKNKKQKQNFVHVNGELNQSKRKNKSNCYRKFTLQWFLPYDSYQ